MKWRRLVIFEVEAEDLEEACSIWCEDGPECGARVRAVDSSQFEATVPPHGTSAN